MKWDWDEDREREREREREMNWRCLMKRNKEKWMKKRKLIRKIGKNKKNNEIKKKRNK